MRRQTPSHALPVRHPLRLHIGHCFAGGGDPKPAGESRVHRGHPGSRRGHRRGPGRGVTRGRPGDLAGGRRGGAATATATAVGRAETARVELTGGAKSTTEIARCTVLFIVH